LGARGGWEINANSRKNEKKKSFCQKNEIRNLKEKGYSS
jgi:hypothetical protein